MPDTALSCICPSTYPGPCTCGRAPVSRAAHITRGDSGRTLCDKPVETTQYADYVVLCQECSSVFTKERALDTFDKMAKYHA